MECHKYDLKIVKFRRERRYRKKLPPHNLIKYNKSLEKQHPVSSISPQVCSLTL